MSSATVSTILTKQPLATVPERRTRVSVAVVAIVCCTVATIALHAALRWYDHPVGSVLVDPDAAVSNASLPTWEGMRQKLRFPDRVVAVDGEQVAPRPGRSAADVWDAAIDRAAAAGRPSVHAVVRTQAGDTRELDLPIVPLGAAAWWVDGGALMLIGSIYALAAVIALGSAPRSRLARSFAKVAFFTSMLLFTIFDFHTSRLLLPIVELAHAMLPPAFLTLALRLPDDVAALRRWPWIPAALDGCGLLLAALMFERNLIGETTIPLRMVATALIGASMLFFVGTLLLRWIRAKGERRTMLRVLFVAMAVANLPVVGFLLLSDVASPNSSQAFFVGPALAASPLAIVVAFIRYDLWGSRALLSRFVTRGVAAMLTALVAIAMGAAFATSVGGKLGPVLVAAAVAGAASAVMVHLALRAVDRSFFPAIASYKPTVGQLSEELTNVSDPRQVANAIERTVRRWLPCDRVKLEILPREPQEGATVDTAPHTEDALALLVSFGGAPLAVLRLGKKRGGALYTTDDVDLLRTIANQGALSLAYAFSYAELEERRRTQAAAWQHERVALVETMAVEIAHEIRYPINFFRSVFSAGRAGKELDQEEIEIGGEEIDRMERLVGGLRRMVADHARAARRPMLLVDVAARVEMLLRDSLSGRELEVDVPEDVAVVTSPDQITQIVVNLVANALEATTRSDALGLRWAWSVDGGGEIVVWDAGPGFEAEASRLFLPWYSTKARGTGLGLAITQRLVRAHGWRIDAVRDRAITKFIISVPSSDVVVHASRRLRQEGA